MKAAERKHLETNALSEQLTKLFQGGSKVNTMWVLLGVALVGGFLYWWLTSALSVRAADSWSKLWLNQDSFRFNSVEADLKNTSAGLAADLLAADAMVSGAKFSMQSDLQSAVGIFESAAEKYLDVGVRAKNIPEVRLRATMAAGKCFETVGKLDRAVGLYKNALADAQSQGLNAHPLAKEAADRIALLNGPKSEGQEFYTQWPTRLPKARPDDKMEAPTPPPIPPSPGPIDPTATAPKPTTLAPPVVPTSPAANPQRPDMGGASATPGATMPMATKPAASATSPTPPASSAPKSN